MKNNLILLGILIVLLTGTYFFLEKPGHDHGGDLSHLIKKEEIREVKFSNVDAHYKELQWHSESTLISHNEFNKILDLIAQIAVIKKIDDPGEEDSYFKSRLGFRVNNEEWLIGDYNLEESAFYLKKGKELFLATLHSESDEIHHESENPLLKKMNLFKDLLNKDLNALKETQLFRYYPKLPVGVVEIESEGKGSFKLDLVQNKTEPSPFKGIEVHQDLLSKFYSSLTQIMIKEEVKYPLNFKGYDLGKMIFTKDSSVTVWKIVLRSKDSADVFVVDEGNKQAFLAIGGSLRILFSHVQDFWDKKVIPPEEFKSFDKLNLVFTQKDKEATVLILNRNPLEFESKGFRVNEENMNKIINVIFNLTHFDQADRVSPLSETDKKLIMNEMLLKINVLGQELVIWPKVNELIVANLTQGFKGHFFKSEESFPTNFEDVLK